MLILYWSALSAPFVYDDLSQIVKNPQLSSFYETFKLYCLMPSAFTNQFMGAGGTNLRPLFWLSLSLDRHIWGVNGASGFHFTNIFLQWINGFLLFVILCRVSIPSLTAAVTALIWLGMPINSEPVAWVSGREYILCGLFLLLVFRCAHSYYVQKTKASVVGVFAWSLAALLSHEAGILAGPLIILLAYSMGTLFKRSTAILVSSVVASDLVFGGMRQLVGAHAGSGSPRLWSIGPAFWKYMLWMIAPIHMSMQRTMSTPPNAPSQEAIVAACAMIGVCIGAFVIRKKAPFLAVGIAWTSIAILPFCGVVYIYQGMAERFCYFASVGIALVVSSLMFQHGRTLRQIASTVAILWMAWGAWRLRLRVIDWCDPVALYESSIEATPDPMLFYNLGWAWRERGDYEKALADYEEAARRRPDYQEAQASVGQMLSIMGRSREALAPFDRALTLKPEDSPTRVDLAMTLAQLGDKKGAEREFRTALAYTPENLSALTDFGSLLVQEGRSDEAMPYFQKAINASPSDADAYYNLGVLFVQMGQMAKALPLFQKALLLKPDDPDTLAIMAKLYGQR